MEKHDWNRFPELKAEGISLRRPLASDAPEVHFLRSSPEVNALMIRPLAQSEEVALAFIQKVTGEFKEQRAIYWVIQEEGSNTMIGSISLWNFSEDKAELGYDLHPNFHKRGIMSAAVEQVIAYAFEAMDFSRLEAYTQRNNPASQKLLTKYGFVHLPKRICNTNPLNWIYELKRHSP